MPQLYPVSSSVLQSDLLNNKQVSLSVLRFDKIHPVIAGNKLFKLHYFLEQINASGISNVVTFGGAFSNHLVAAAYACKLRNLKCTGIVRGERPPVLSHTLQNCIEFGMQLKFLSRNDYQQKDEPAFLQQVVGSEEGCYCIPEGGYHPLGAAGAAAMMSNVPESATHIICAVGTATTVAGLLIAAKNHQQVIAIPVLKGMNDLQQRLEFLTQKKYSEQLLHIAGQYHFGGYAKTNQQLFDFMNQLYETHKLPTDFVYTAKMMYGVMDMIRHNFFAPGSKIVCMHTGGLQGNLSLQKGILTFA